MNSYSYENDYLIEEKKLPHNNYDDQSEKISSVSENKLAHQFLNYLNISIITFIIIFSFLSFDSQRKWTNYYSAITLIRNVNDNLLDYHSKAEEYFLDEIGSLDYIRNANTKDLIYLSHPPMRSGSSFLSNLMKQFHEGLKEGFYQRGY